MFILYFYTSSCLKATIQRDTVNHTLSYQVSIKQTFGWVGTCIRTYVMLKSFNRKNYDRILVELVTQ